ncbi:MAG: GIY-YIG nuclease family protein, partial [Thaumarchaeota archaeon]|nr:GIY-YIG nuclease family protein [Nitrososphaerota archaeon]
MALDISSLNIPSHSGIYIMKDGKNDILYIGKAKNLKNRVRSYFVKNQNYKTQKLVEKIRDIEFVLTDNEEEAFLLESNMIKRYRPPYNIELKDQQRYT